MMSMLVAFALKGQEKSANEPRTITIRLQKAPVKEILKEIEKQAGVTFSYESSLLKELPKVNFRADGETLAVCLDRLFAKLPVVYKATGKIVVLKQAPRQVTVSGFVQDKTSAESLAGASVYDTRDHAGTASNSFGFFSLTLPPGATSLRISYIGYEPCFIPLHLSERDTAVNVLLVPNASLQEVVVTARDLERQPVQNTHMGKMEIDQAVIRATPTLLGEADIIKTLQLTPGVANGTEGVAGLYVRGGGGDENLFLIDGNPVYQVNHVGGLFSAFNAEAVRNMEFFKAGFPARYGGRLSSVVDVNTRDGNMKEYHGSASLGLISGNLSLEGPIVRDKTAFLIALRRTWLDVLTAPAIAIANKKRKGSRIDLRYAFHDLNVKVNHRFSDRSQAYISLYNGNDVLKAANKEFPTAPDAHYLDRDDASMRWGNLLASAGWTYAFHPKLAGKISAVYSEYHSKITYSDTDEEGIPGEEDYTYKHHESSNQNNIRDLGIRSSFDYQPVYGHHIRFGADYLYHDFRPEHDRSVTASTAGSQNDRREKVFGKDRIPAHEMNLFAEDTWTLSPAVSLNAGLRFSLFRVEGQSYTGVEPRLSARWLLSDRTSVKASYARMNQYVHLVSNSYLNLPTDAWMPVTRSLKPLVSDQVSAGVYYRLNGTFDLSAEGYYKHMNNLLEYKDGYSFIPANVGWEGKMAAGSGRAYGAEFMVRKAAGRATGWIGYTLSWADRRFSEIDEGRRFPARYDNRHKLNIVAMYKLTPKVELSGAWTYSSGNHTTLSLESYENGALPIPGGADIYPGDYPPEIDHFEGRNNYQLPAYHRLDLGIKIYRPKKKGRMGIWEISLYNVYSRMNPFMIRKTTKTVKEFHPVGNGGYGYYVDKEIPCFKQIGFLPVVPSISYTYKF